MLESIRTKLGGSGQGAESLDQDACAMRAKCLRIIGWVAMLSFAFHACTHMVAAGDTWVAMACGRHFVNHGVDTVEPFSANSHKAGPTAEEIENWPGWAKWITEKVGIETVRKWHPTGWVNQNWLTHVIFYKLSTMFGSKEDPYFNALIFWKFAVYLLTLFCLYGTARTFGVNRLLAAGFCCFAMFVGRSFIDVRPAGFSNLLVAAFLLILALTSYRNALYIWLIVPLVVFWSNVHGGYLYAFIVLVPFVGWHLMMRLPKRWLIALYSILTWLVLYGMANRFRKGLYELVEQYLGEGYSKLKPIDVNGDPIIYILFLAILAVLGLAIAWQFIVPIHRKTVESLLAVVSVGVSGILFLSLLFGRFYPEMPSGLSEPMMNLLNENISSGRFDYMGIFLFALILAGLLVYLKDRAVRVMEFRTIWHTIGAGAVAFVAMIVFNPFHLTNLTHTFIISMSKHAQRWRDVHEWHRAFAWDNPVGTAIPFLVMCMIAWFGLITWLVVSIQMAKKKGKTGDRLWPKIDLSLFVIGALTIYMAIRSRRFIPIAAYAACPPLALMIQEIVTSVLTLTSLRRYKRLPESLIQAVREAILVGAGGALIAFIFWRLLFWKWLFHEVPNNPTLVQPNFGLTLLGVLQAFGVLILIVMFYFASKEDRQDDAPRPNDWIKPAGWAAAVVLSCFAIGFGGWVSLKFKRVYLNYWPSDPDLTSVFMRMTASDAKPFEACQFIRDNKLSGHMFNYWTEGGFIAWGQDPDPETGKTPLQLFMDGRAQAAYDRRTFDRWTLLMAGGDIGRTIERRARAANRSPTSKEYAQVGRWMAEQFDKYGVWVVLMPSGQFDKIMVRGLEHDPSWRTAFINNRQKLLINIHTEQGKKLFEGMFNGKTVYPNEFTANLSIGYNLLMSNEVALRKDGLEKVIKAFELNPSPQPMVQLLLTAAPQPELLPRVDEVCIEYVTNFEKNRKEQYIGKDGYNFRLEAARLALYRIAQIAAARGDVNAAEERTSQRDQYEHERDEISLAKRW